MNLATTSGGVQPHHGSVTHFDGQPKVRFGMGFRYPFLLDDHEKGDLTAPDLTSKENPVICMPNPAVLEVLPGAW